MSTERQVQKYIHDINACTRIEVFIDKDNQKGTSRWFHYLSRKGRFLGFSIEFPYIAGQSMDEIVKNAIDYMTGPIKTKGFTDVSVDLIVRKFHVREYIPDGVIVRKKGKWTWIK